MIYTENRHIPDFIQNFSRKEIIRQTEEWMRIWWSWMWGSGGGSFELGNGYLGSKECREFLDQLIDRYFSTRTAWIDVITISFAYTRSTISRSDEWPWPCSLSLLVTYVQWNRVLRSNMNHPVLCSVSFLFTPGCISFINRSITRLLSFLRSPSWRIFPDLTINLVFEV